MFVTPAYAQTGAGGPDMLISILPFVLIFVIMYFLIIRPQRQQMKRRQEMLAAVRRGDTVVTGGGIAANLARVLPRGSWVELDRSLWSPLPVFRVLTDLAGASLESVEGTWNLGIGMFAVVVDVTLHRRKQPRGEVMVDAVMASICPPSFETLKFPSDRFLPTTT